MKILTDRTIYQKIRDAGLVASQYEFSRLCGRSKSWFSCLAARDLSMSITALGVLTANIERIAINEADADQVRQLREFGEQLRQEMDRRCAQRAVASAKRYAAA
jgi:hypothetical protein